MSAPTGIYGVIIGMIASLLAVTGGWVGAIIGVIIFVGGFYLLFNYPRKTKGDE